MALKLTDPIADKLDLNNHAKNIRFQGKLLSHWDYIPQLYDILLITLSYGNGISILDVGIIPMAGPRSMNESNA